MFHFLGFLFIIIIAILIIGLSVISAVIRSIFSLGGHRASSGSYQKSGGYSYNSHQQHPDSSSQQNEATEPEDSDIPLRHKKLFAKDEGEYVDFEEIKE
ncbi:DUF4834 family protein [Bacteroides helcogenes]|uniref:DUF4834 family protein n=1 Tax=Bacteroides helcogenes (strain ATCC 35417 / DSM 20613 / JCM 6297 / CCUG 15421 / P 36-108) TaxID=693979 RepID=E6STF2_BACT6|nr:DUF4834 family protein [Bacteroides helcogenes]ADV43226.1 hypothetical protein Bache_1216 [Bacteroides helcogenes P 36-108]MDY5239201.1 DUF4834 family protein [Bacteroides helcogenes]